MANTTKGVRGFVSSPLEERFFSKVKIPEDRSQCWIWTASDDGKGYGIIWVSGRKKKATRVSWEIHNGKPFPEGMSACHSCDNPRCVNPNHIWPGLHQENMADASNKGRLSGKKGPQKNKATHCIRGHKFTDETTIIKSSGYRACAICAQAFNKARWDKTRKQREANGEKMWKRPDSVTKLIEERADDE